MKTKYKILIALTLLVVFGLGVAAGVLGERTIVHKRSRQPVPARTHVPSLDSWAKDLGLSPEQQEKIREIFKKNEERMKAYWIDGTAKYKEIRGMLKAEIDSVLTPEQKQKMEEMIRQHEERRKNEPDRYNSDRNNSREGREQDKLPPERKR